MTHILLFSLPDFIIAEFHAHKTTIVFIVIGMIASFIAQMILPGRGFGMLASIGIGIAGAWLGEKFLYPYMTFISDALFRIIAAATVGAMVLSVIINLIRGGEDKDLTHWRDR